MNSNIEKAIESAVNGARAACYLTGLAVFMILSTKFISRLAMMIIPMLVLAFQVQSQTMITLGATDAKGVNGKTSTTGYFLFNHGGDVDIEKDRMTFDLHIAVGGQKEEGYLVESQDRIIFESIYLIRYPAFEIYVASNTRSELFYQLDGDRIFENTASSGMLVSEERGGLRISARIGGAVRISRTGSDPGVEAQVSAQGRISGTTEIDVKARGFGNDRNEEFSVQLMTALRIGVSDRTAIAIHGNIERYQERWLRDTSIGLSFSL